MTTGKSTTEGNFSLLLKPCQLPRPEQWRRRERQSSGHEAVVEVSDLTKPGGSELQKPHLQLQLRKLLRMLLQLQQKSASQTKMMPQLRVGAAATKAQACGAGQSTLIMAGGARITPELPGAWTEGGSECRVRKGRVWGGDPKKEKMYNTRVLLQSLNFTKRIVQLPPSETGSVWMGDINTAPKVTSWWESSSLTREESGPLA